MKNNILHFPYFLKRFNFNLLVVVCVFGFISGCQKDKLTTEISKDIVTENFNTITINGVCDIYLVQDTFYGVSIKGFDKWVNASTAIVTDSTLTIETNHKGEFIHPSRENTKVFVHFNSIKRINANEVCHIRTTSPLTGREIGLVTTTKMVIADLALNCQVFYFWNNPNGTNLKLTGSVNELKLWCTGLSSVDAQSLFSSYVFVEDGAQGDIRVRATQTLDYSLTNSGNIYYYGNPTTILPNQITGSGKLIDAE